MQETENYGLHKPDYADTVDIAQLNENADVIDTALQLLESNQQNHFGDALIHVTAADKLNWNAKETPDGAQDKVDVHANNQDNPHGVTIAQIGAAATKTTTATLGLAAWQGASAPYTQTLSIGGILASDDPVVGPVLPEHIEQAKEILDAWSNVSRIKTQNSGIVVICYTDKPTAAIPIQIKVVR